MIRTLITPSDLLVTIWNPIEKLATFFAQANLPHTEQQQNDFALQFIQNTRDFEQGLENWNNEPTGKKNGQISSHISVGNKKSLKRFVVHLWYKLDLHMLTNWHLQFVMK